MPGGRPLKYQDPAEMEAKIDEYFTACESGRQREIVVKKDKSSYTVQKVTERTPYTIQGLAHYLGFSDTESLSQYETRSPRSEEFVGIILRAKLRIIQNISEKAMTGEYNPRFAEFYLACNAGWRKKEEAGIPMSALFLLMGLLPGQIQRQLASMVPQLRQLQAPDTTPAVVDATPTQGPVRDVMSTTPKTAKKRRKQQI